MPLVFAYGSNMDKAHMARRCPKSQPIGSARLLRYRIFIMREGYASVVSDPSRSVHGIVWNISLADMAALDRYENIDGGLYRKRLQLVHKASGGIVQALVYVGRSKEPGLPLPGYIEMVARAALSWGMPSAYIREIEALKDRRSRAQEGDAAQ